MGEMKTLLLFASLVTICFSLALANKEGRRKEIVQQVTENNDTNDISGTYNINDTESRRNNKLFPLFSVVQFKNTGCRSQSSMSSGQSAFRNGTCYTSSECNSKGGTASGNCAAGFGVCCLFLVSTTGTTINQNCTYIRNPGFPSAYSGTGAVSYTINKCSSDVCWLRLDFETFQILGPSSTTEPTGSSCPDTFIMTTSTTPSSVIPTICGTNTGSHVYIDMGNLATDTSTLSFAFTGTSTTRIWEIKVTQVQCSNVGRPPSGCLQYYTTLTGRITTFNFKSTTSSHLNSQDQTVCVRQAQGYCCVQYQLCTDQPNPFSLDRIQEAFIAAISGQVDSSCTTDYTAIPGSLSGQCNNRLSNQFTRYCGFYLGLTAVGGNQPICDCTAPFTVNFHTDAATDTKSAIAPASRGVCLDYTQIPCNS